jgi:hypothetical protein
MLALGAYALEPQVVLSAYRALPSHCSLLHGRRIDGPQLASRRRTIPGQHGCQLLITTENVLMVRDLKKCQPTTLLFHPISVSRSSQHVPGAGTGAGSG